MFFKFPTSNILSSTKNRQYSEKTRQFLNYRPEILHTHSIVRVLAQKGHKKKEQDHKQHKESPQKKKKISPACHVN